MFTVYLNHGHHGQCFNSGWEKKNNTVQKRGLFVTPLSHTHTLHDTPSQKKSGMSASLCSAGYDAITREDWRFAPNKVWGTVKSKEVSSSRTRARKTDRESFFFLKTNFYRYLRWVTKERKKKKRSESTWKRHRHRVSWRTWSPEARAQVSNQVRVSPLRQGWTNKHGFYI